MLVLIIDNKLVKVELQYHQDFSLHSAPLLLKIDVLEAVTTSNSIEAATTSQGMLISVL